MMTTVSIDAVGALAVANNLKGGEDVPVAPGEAVALFRSSLAEQTEENGTLSADLRAAMTAVGETLAKVATVSGQETVAVPAVREPLPQQVAENVSLGADLVATSEVVGETLAKVATVSGQETVAVPAVREPLPQQVAENISLGEDLRVATTTVGETLTKVAATVEEMPEAMPEETPETTADALVAAGVAAAAAPTAPVAESAPTAVIAPVDVVRMQATEAVPSAVLVQAAEAVADTLLVTPGLLRGQGEVLVRLRPDVLEGTEVKISVTGRQLDVVFQPQTVDMAVMIENCRSQLVQHLAAKIVSFNVSVDVRKKAVGRA